MDFESLDGEELAEALESSGIGSGDDERLAAILGKAKPKKKAAFVRSAQARKPMPAPRKTPPRPALRAAPRPGVPAKKTALPLARRMPAPKPAVRPAMRPMARPLPPGLAKRGLSALRPVAKPLPGKATPKPTAAKKLATARLVKAAVLKKKAAGPIIKKAPGLKPGTVLSVTSDTFLKRESWGYVLTRKVAKGTMTLGRLYRNSAKKSFSFAPAPGARVSPESLSLIKSRLPAPENAYSFDAVPAKVVAQAQKKGLGASPAVAKKLVQAMAKRAKPVLVKGKRATPPPISPKLKPAATLSPLTREIVKAAAPVATAFALKQAGKGAKALVKKLGKKKSPARPVSAPGLGPSPSPGPVPTSAPPETEEEAFDQALEEASAEAPELMDSEPSPSSDEAPADEALDESSDTEPSDDEPSDDEPSDDEPSDDEPLDEDTEPSDEDTEPSDDESSDDDTEASDDEASDEESSDEEPADEDDGSEEVIAGVAKAVALWDPWHRHGLATPVAADARETLVSGPFDGFDDADEISSEIIESEGG